MLDPSKGIALCGCGCEKPAPIAGYSDKRKGIVKGQPLRFINGHNRRLEAKGKSFLHQGRWYIRDRNSRVVPWSHVIMEDKIGRPINHGEIVHHKDQNSANDHPDNLVLYASNAEHMRAEHSNDLAKNMLHWAIKQLGINHVKAILDEFESE